MRSSRLPLLFRRALLTFVFAAMLARVLVPQGWMPAMDGSMKLIPCSGTGPVTMPAAMSVIHAGHHMPAKQDPKAESSCAFAALGQALLEPGLLSIMLAPVVYVVAGPLPTQSVAVGQGLAAPPPPATGPPSTP